MGILRAERHVRLFELAAPEANMSDEPAEEEIDEMEPDPDLIDEEIDEEIEIDLEGDDLPDDDDDDENQEIPAGARPTSDDDEDDEDDKKRKKRTKALSLPLKATVSLASKRMRSCVRDAFCSSKNRNTT